MYSFNKPIFYGLLLAAGLLNSCGGADPDIRADDDFLVIDTFWLNLRSEVDQKTFSLRKILGSIPAPGFEQPDVNLVISNASDWASFWSDYSNTFAQPQPLPQVDFQSTNVAVVQRQTTCDTVDRIVEIAGSQFKGIVTVIRDEKTADPAFKLDCKLPQSHLRMVHVVLLEIKNVPIEFIDQGAIQ